ncbi:transposable element Tc3 transposase [Trichonephila clavipes]|nr:transposable element Tc3 transposase [Trichonephila clavipes]
MRCQLQCGPRHLALVQNRGMAVVAEWYSSRTLIHLLPSLIVPEGGLKVCLLSDLRPVGSRPLATSSKDIARRQEISVKNKKERYRNVDAEFDPMMYWRLLRLVNCALAFGEEGWAPECQELLVVHKFVERAQNEIAVVPDFHKRILFSDEAHFWLNGYVNKQNCRIWSEANPHVYVETPLHPEKLTVWCALWAGGILLQKR